jgi:hypothetical protein
MEATMAHVTIPDRETGGAQFSGTEVARVNTRYGPPGIVDPVARPRWGENVVWRLDGSDHYILLRGAYSVIYHCSPTSCRIAGGAMAGDGAHISDLPDDAEPCPLCKPPLPFDLGDYEPIRYEFPRQTIEECHSAALVARQLSLTRKGKGVSTIVMPEPARYLLRLCAENDDAFRDLQLPMQQIRAS